MQEPPPKSRTGMPYSTTGTRFEQMNRPMRNNAVQRPNAPPPKPMPDKTPCENTPDPKPKQESILNSLFSGDADVLLIILIIVLLMKEKADMKLIIALGYLLI